MKSPPIQHRDEAARDETERFIAAHARTAPTKTAAAKANGKAAKGDAKVAKAATKARKTTAKS